MNDDNLPGEDPSRAVLAYARWDVSLLRLADDAFANPRTHTGISPGDIRELALDIFRRGLFVPLLVTEDGLVVAGSRRYRAVTMLRYWREQLASDLAPSGADHERAYVNARVGLITSEVPIAIVSGTVGDRTGLERLEGIAIADNLQRAELSGYEVAARLSVLQARGATGAQIARLIGKSASYVSRKLSTWKNAGEELRAAWRDGMPEESVAELSALSREDQARALAGPIPRGRRGPAHRPSVDMVRDFLQALEKQEAVDTTGWSAAEKLTEHAYRAGVLDALRWATGGQTDTAFVKLAEQVQVT